MISYLPPPSLYREAGVLPGETLRALDELHLLSSIRLDVDALVTDDVRLIAAAETARFRVHAPAA